MAAARPNAFSCIFLEGTDLYINQVDQYPRQFMGELDLSRLPSATPAVPWAGTSTRPSPFWTGTTSTCCWTGRPT